MIRKHLPEAASVEDSGVAYRSRSVIALLGGSEVISVQSLSNDIVKGEIARTGVPKRAAMHLQDLLGLTAKEMSSLLDMSYRTFQRKHADDKLGLSSTEQLIEIAEVIEHALEVFRSRQQVVSWLNTPLIGLEGRRPMDLLDNSFGIRVVRQALGRLEHGVFS
jgi:putative toxin-antitoxin system antitoxin component (TIGR02293 family)